jgi:predicted lipoprotein with Yx(FWY)xxD motif
MCLKFEKEDFYLNHKGLMVLTEKYHIKKGSCCGGKCKHCPYWPPYQKSNKELREDAYTGPTRLQN